MKGSSLMRPLSKQHRERAEDAFAPLCVTQTEFWRALGELESCLGIELDSTVDFRDTNIDLLLQNVRTAPNDRRKDIRPTVAR